MALVEEAPLEDEILEHKLSTELFGIIMRTDLQKEPAVEVEVLAELTGLETLMKVNISISLMMSLMHIIYRPEKERAGRGRPEAEALGFVQHSRIAKFRLGRNQPAGDGSGGRGGATGGLLAGNIVEYISTTIECGRI